MISTTHPSFSNLPVNHSPCYEEPLDITVTIHYLDDLDFIYYGISREKFGQVEVYYEYTMEEGSKGNFSITFPRPPKPVEEWSIQIYGFRKEEGEVFSSIRNAQEFFESQS